MGYIYLITNTITGKQYVGQTTQLDVNKRWGQHKNGKGVGICLLNAYNKYGFDKFMFKLICICFDDDCNDYEEEYIKKFNTLAPNGYNLREGGMNSKQHPDTIKKRNETRNKTLNDRKLQGLPLLPPATNEQKKKQSERMKGIKRGKMSDKQKEKLSDTYKKLWQERKENGSFDSYKPINLRTTSGISPNRKRVGKYDEHDILLEEYESTVDAGAKNKISHSSIAKVCRCAPSYKTAGGFIWKFL
jgi:group I intron endonuclease